MRLTPLSGRRF